MPPRAVGIFRSFSATVIAPTLWVPSTRIDRSRGGRSRVLLGGSLGDSAASLTCAYGSWDCQGGHR